MSKGWLADWRQEGLYDLAMPDLQYKVWRALQYRALHSKIGNLEPGDMMVSYNDLREMLRREDGKLPSEMGIRQALEKLEKRKYIKRTVQPGRPMRIRILGWEQMQGRHVKGYEFTREGHQLPPSAEDDLFGSSLHPQSSCGGPPN